MREGFFSVSERSTVREILQASEKQWSMNCAFQAPEGPITYHELVTAVRGNAARLYGVTKGAKVLLLSDEKRIRCETALSILSAMYAGICVILMPSHSDAQTVLQVAKDFQADVLLTDRPIHGIQCLPLGLLPEEWAQPELPDVDGEDECMVLFTSGTTSQPKAAMITQMNLCSDAVAGSRLIPFTPQQRYVSCLPYFHGYAILCDLIAPLMGGACLYTASSAGILLDMINASPTNINGVPELAMVIARVLETGMNATELSELKCILCGGAMMPLDLYEMLQKHGVEVYNCYGLTEFSTAIAVNSPKLNEPRSVGLVLPCCEVQIAADGEILARGTNLMKGYGPQGPWISRDDWFHTGDLGYLDEQGLLYITGRKDDVINLPNGEKINPVQIEAILEQDPAVREACVYCPIGKNYLAVRICPEGDQGAAENAVRCYNESQTYGRRIASLHFSTEPFERNALGKLIRRQYNE